MERSFARSTRFDFDHARWRGLWKMKIQEYLTCAIQNIQTLIRNGSKPQKAAAARVMVEKVPIAKVETAVISKIEAVLWPSNMNFGCFVKEHDLLNRSLMPIH